MFLYTVPYTQIPDPNPLVALMPPDRRARFDVALGDPGPLFAYTLLALALERHYGVSAQDIVYTDRGKPYLPHSSVRFSLSHCKTHALCAVADFPVGCDIETRRPVSDHTCRRVLAPTEDASDFFAYWTLKESYLKLAGGHTRPYADIAFTLTDDHATGGNARGFLYRLSSDCTAAVLAREPFSRPELTILSPAELFSYAMKK